MIFIRISNSGRPTVLIVGSWFVVWLLNNRPALHTGRIRLTYPALKVVLKPISWNHQKALFGLKPRPPCGLVGPNHLIPSHLAYFLTNTASHTQPEEKLRTQSQRWAPSPPGLRTLRWDRLSVFSYTKILLILFFKKRLFYPTWLGSILEKRVAETSEPASGKQFPLKMRSNNCQQDSNSFKKCAATIASEIPPNPCNQC